MFKQTFRSTKHFLRKHSILTQVIAVIILFSSALGISHIISLQPKKITHVLAGTIHTSPSLSPSFPPTEIPTVTSEPIIFAAAIHKQTTTPTPTHGLSVSTPSPSQTTPVNTQQSQTNTNAQQTVSTNQSPPTPTPQPIQSIPTVNIQLTEPDGSSSFSVTLLIGATVCEVMSEAKTEGKIKSLTLDDSYQSTLHSAYVKEMNGYKDNWTFSVNGTSPLGCSLSKPNPGDQIIWKFG